ncbi:MAG: transporter [Aliihoeflea sp.]|uniref:transporter n=1 Tax=Aliihoeflea sp. TaxID=2608088 RepID=UPI00403412B4
MPSADYVQQSLSGAARLMAGKKDGLRFLDISADGFWTSFFAIVIALPAMTVGWVTLANELAFQGDGIGSRFSIVLRLATIDVLAWIIPLAVFALLAKPAGIASRFVHFVVASNWGSAIYVWIMLPPSLIRLFWPDAGEGVTAFSLGLFFFTMVLAWRLTNAVLDKGPAFATGVFTAMFLVSLFVLFTLQGVFGLVQS